MQLVFTKYKFVTHVLCTTFWLLAVLPFFFCEMTQKLANEPLLILYMLGDAVIFVMGVWLMRDWRDWAAVISFVLLSYICTCIVNGYSLLFYLNGARMYIGYIFVVPIIRYLFYTEAAREFFLDRMEKYLYWFLWLQIPCMVIQCVLYGAYDNVGGSLGWFMSGVISTLIYFISFYLMVRRWDYSLGYLGNLKKNWILLFLLFPTALNETKISFIYLLFYFFFLLPMDRKYVKRLLIIIPVLFFVAGGAIWAYASIYGDSENVIKDTKDLSDYMFGDDVLNDWILDVLENDYVDVDETDYARGVKMYVIPEILNRDPNAPVWGYGIGQFKGGAFVEKSEFAKHYEWILQGTIMPVMEIWLEMGLLGLIWYVGLWIIYFRKDKGDKAQPRLIAYSITILLLTTLYALMFIYYVFGIIFFFVMFASLKWQYFENRRVPKLTVPLFTPYVLEPYTSQEDA